MRMRKSVRIYFILWEDIKKTQPMQQHSIINELPPTNEGDIISITLEITKVNNGFIVKNNDSAANKIVTMVFNGEQAHKLVSGYVLDLAIPNMQEGEIIIFGSTITYQKKNNKNGD